jgi:hypothetical protein
MARRYMTVSEVAERYALSQYQIRWRASHGFLPHRKHAGGSRLLFVESDLDAYDDGAVELETRELPAPIPGMSPGRLVRPVGGAA